MQITVYSLPVSQCRDCWSTERRFASFGLDVKKINLAGHPNAIKEIEELGYRQAPVVVVEDEGGIIDSWSGYKETKIEALARRVA